MRITTLFRRLLGVISLFVCSVAFEEDGLVLRVRPRWLKPRCGGCGRRAPGYDRLPERRWRHLGLGRMRIWLAYALRRVDCCDCGVRTEQVPWAPHGSRFTWDFEELVAYLAQITDMTKVTELMGISWRDRGFDRGAGRGPKPRPHAARGAAKHRGRRVQLSQTPPLHHHGRGPRSPAGRLGRPGEDLRCPQGILRRTGRGTTWEDRVRNHGHGSRIHQGGRGEPAEGRDCLRPLPRAASRVGCTRRSTSGPAPRDPRNGRGAGAVQEPLRVAQEPVEPEARGEAETQGGSEDERADLPCLPPQGDPRPGPGLPATLAGRARPARVVGLGVTLQAQALRQGSPDDP